MKKWLTLALISISPMANSEIKFENPSGPDKAYLAYYEDPFDGNKTYKYVGIPYGATVTCGGIKISTHRGYFDDFSWPAKVRFRINKVDFELTGTYGTMGIISDQRFYFVTKSKNGAIFSKLIEAMKAGNSAIVGGKTDSEWDHKTISLAGFTKAYAKLACD